MDLLKFKIFKNIIKRKEELPNLYMSGGGN